MTYRDRTDEESGVRIRQHSRKHLTTWKEGSGVSASTLTNAQREVHGKDMRLRLDGAILLDTAAGEAPVLLLTEDMADAILDVIGVLMDELETLAELPPTRQYLRRELDFVRRDEELIDAAFGVNVPTPRDGSLGA